MKKALLIALVVLVVVTGVPVVVTMGGMACQNCGPAAIGASACAAILMAFGLFVVYALELVRSRRERNLGGLYLTIIDPPPRLA